MLVELDDYEEAPVMDGSAGPFTALIREPASRIRMQARKNISRGRSVLRKFASSRESAWMKGGRGAAPYFDEMRFLGDDQRLNLAGPRSDLRLNELIASVVNPSPELPGKSWLLYGFSGGGQFVHRYAAIHPDRAARVVARTGGLHGGDEGGV